MNHPESIEKYFNEELYRKLNRKRQITSFLLAKDYVRLEEEYFDAEQNHPEDIPKIIEKYNETIRPELIRLGIINEEGEVLDE